MGDCFRIQIRRENIREIHKRFCEFESEFDIGNNRTVIDGKCLSSFHALDVSMPLNVECFLQNYETIKQIMKRFQEYLL